MSESCNTMDWSPPGSSLLGILQARILEWVTISFFKGSSRPRDQTWVSCIADRYFTAEPPGKPCQSVSSVAQSSPTLCDPTDCSTPSLPIHHQLPEFTQTHVHWVGGAIQPSHPLSSLVPFSSCLQYFPASESFPMSQLFASSSQSIGASASISVLPMNIQGWFPVGLNDWISLLSKELSSLL